MKIIDELTMQGKEKETKITFWTSDANGKVKINQIDLIRFSII